MKDFVSAALPFVLTGIALAILAVNHNVEDHQKEKKGTRMAMGAGFGLLMGSLLNSCGLWESHALGLVIGPLWEWHWHLYIKTKICHKRTRTV